MTYWILMAGVLLVGYVLIKWSGRADVQENEGAISLGVGTNLGDVGIRTTSRVTPTDQAGNHGEDAGNRR